TEGESPAFGLFHAVAFSTAPFTHRFCYRATTPKLLLVRELFTASFTSGCSAFLLQPMVTNTPNKVTVAIAVHISRMVELVLLNVRLLFMQSALQSIWYMPAGSQSFSDVPASALFIGRAPVGFDYAALRSGFALTIDATIDDDFLDCIRDRIQ